MMRLTLVLMTAFAMLATGCTKKGDSTGVLQPILTAWQQGDQATAVQRFVEADWTRRPLFASDSPLNFTEKQFAALSPSEQEVKAKQFMARVPELRELGMAVLNAGNDAAEKKDMVKARTYIVAVQHYGEALNHADHPAIVQLVGKALKKMSDTALGKLNP